MLAQLTALIAQLDPATKTKEWNDWLAAIRGPGFALASALILITTLLFFRTLGAIIRVVVVLAVAYMAIGNPGLGQPLIEVII